LTVQLAQKHRKPHLVIQLDRDADPTVATRWIRTLSVQTLNIAGPRESKRPGVYERALRFVQRLLEE
jgi:hypothetical protein